MATPKQERVAKNLTENVRNKKPETLGKIIKDSGYSKTMSTQPSRIINSVGVTKELKPFVEQLKKERELAMKAITQIKRDTTGYKDLVGVTDTLTKNIQLLEGKATERVGSILELTEPEQEVLDKLVKEREKAL